MLDVSISFELEPSDNPLPPIHPVRLEFKPTIELRAGARANRNVTGGLIVHTLESPLVMPMDSGLYEEIDVSAPGQVVGHGTPAWSATSAIFRSGSSPIHVASFETKGLRLRGRAFLPYVQNSARFATPTAHLFARHVLDGLAEVAYERGSLEGRSVFGAAVWLAEEDEATWYQLRGVYRSQPEGYALVQIEYSTQPPENRPLVFWSAQSVFE